MALSIPVTWSDAHRLHAPETAVWVGVPIDADELPERAEHIRAESVDAGARVVDAEPHDDAALLAVHDAGLVDFLRDRLGGLGRGGAATTTPGSWRSSATSFQPPGCSAARSHVCRLRSPRERARGASTR